MIKEYNTILGNYRITRLKSLPNNDISSYEIHEYKCNTTYKCLNGAQFRQLDSLLSSLCKPAFKKVALSRKEMEIILSNTGEPPENLNVEEPYYLTPEHFPDSKISFNEQPITVNNNLKHNEIVAINNISYKAHFIQEIADMGLLNKNQMMQILEPISQSKQCTCDINLLMQAGCQCGSIQRYQEPFKVENKSSKPAEFEYAAPVLKTQTHSYISINGYTWEHDIVNDTWKDMATGLKWYPKENKKYTYEEATAKFNSKEKRLPSIKEFEEAYSHGISQVFTDNNDFFWTNEPHPRNSDYAYVFSGFSGLVDDDFRLNDYSVRCAGG